MLQLLEHHRVIILIIILMHMVAAILDPTNICILQVILYVFLAMEPVGIPLLILVSVGLLEAVTVQHLLQMAVLPMDLLGYLIIFQKPLFEE